MKRATLTAYPSNTSLSEPADVTDRLLEREANSDTRSPPASRRGRPRASRGGRKANSAAPEAMPSGPTPTPAASDLETALAAADSATQALQQAAREAPARYDVALRYRLDALAHHLQQVKEFVTSLAAR